MLAKLSINTSLVGLRLLRLQTAKLFLPPILEKHNINLCQKRQFLIYPKATYATSSKVHLSTYEEIKNLPNHPEKVLIDVREPSELKETGQIPHSINIPLGSVITDLSDDISAEAFEKKYGRKKPHKDSLLIFHCRIGKRSATAADTAIKLGYKNVKNYEGSWLDWAERESLPKG